MSDVRIEDFGGGKIALYSPFNPQFPAPARQLGGKWNASIKAWVFDARDEGRVRELAHSFYGTDGSPQQEGDLVTVRLPLLKCTWDAQLGQETARFAGRAVLTKTDRDTAPTLAPNVVVVEGKIPAYGGSVRNPRVTNIDGVIIEIRDIPRAALELSVAEHYEIVEAKIDYGAMRAERERLKARIAELDALLQSEG